MELIDRLRKDGTLTEAQAAALDDAETGRVFSLSSELRALLYAGAVFLVGGVSATVKKYFDQLGELTILAALTGGVAACAWYVETRRPSYSDGEVPSPTPVYDYILFIGCALVGIEFVYLETQYKLLKDYWDFYLLASGVLFGTLAYRHDNRIVLGMALLNLAAWFGLRYQAFGFMGRDLHVPLMAFGALSAAAGLAGSARGVKPHFLDTYLNIGLNALFWAVVSETRTFASAYFVLLAGLVAVTAWTAVQRRRFVYFLYAALYGFSGFSACFQRAFSLRSEGIALYLLVSGGLLAWALYAFRKHLRQTE